MFSAVPLSMSITVSTRICSFSFILDTLPLSRSSTFHKSTAPTCIHEDVLSRMELIRCIEGKNCT